jgi:cellulose synthase/poly-beta-1,6-N-acetylglucosamine synthase-like glycosyltransferase
LAVTDWMAGLYWLALAALVHTWGLYGLVLWVWSRLRSPVPAAPVPCATRTISVIIAAHNEQDAIARRVEDLTALRGAPAQMEILVASDGSTDQTCAVVRALQPAGVRLRLLEFAEHQGRAAVHNAAAREARGDILVFTDAETRFHEAFLEHILPHFADSRVAAVSGRISYVNEADSAITVSAGLYWTLEERLRVWESRLGILAFGTGAAFCMRRDCYVPMVRAHDDVDYAETLALVGRGMRVQYEPRAVAYDRIAAQVAPTHRARARRTSMAFRSILDGILAHRLWRRPGILFSVVSHKLLRHVSPALMVLLLLCNAALWTRGSWYRATLIFQAGFALVALAGGLAQRWGWRPPPLAVPFAFVLLNFSRLAGLMGGLFRKPPSTYR